ncbi:conjugal transfer protein TraD [Legionella geestiana]|uniref:conjugal transfer protein TraD n=1 Tax=Legionella geestiana TaxID=45065 RepID=UPI001092841D|nr:conjugal transfer protein TraD [Legionella geestiana]QDQ40263.1 conjugal transfer protein TraD [Legionella geestiana]
MTILEGIKREGQLIVRCEKSIKLEKLRKRKADTRRKIELGGLVIKAGLGDFNKPTILGALDYVVGLIANDGFQSGFERNGEKILTKSL